MDDRPTDDFEHHRFKWIEKDCNFVAHKAAEYSLCCNFSFYFNKTNLLGIIDFVYKANNGLKWGRGGDLSWRLSFRCGHSDTLPAGPGLVRAKDPDET